MAEKLINVWDYETSGFILKSTEDDPYTETRIVNVIYRYNNTSWFMAEAKAVVKEFPKLNIKDTITEIEKRLMANDVPKRVKSLLESVKNEKGIKFEINVEGIQHFTSKSDISFLKKLVTNKEGDEFVVSAF